MGPMWSIPKIKHLISFEILSFRQINLTTLYHLYAELMNPHTPHLYSSTNHQRRKEPLHPSSNLNYFTQEGRGHWSVYYTSPQSFIITLFLLLNLIGLFIKFSKLDVILCIIIRDVQCTSTHQHYEKLCMCDIDSTPNIFSFS